MKTKKQDKGNTLNCFTGTKQVKAIRKSVNQVKFNFPKGNIKGGIYGLNFKAKQG
jgi:hypothetical protein